VASLRSFRVCTLGVFAVFLLCGCERGCAKSWLGERGVGNEGPVQQGGPTLHAIDCPDGLARCNGGVVEASRLTSIPLPCKGPVEQCTCPWERAGECDRGCVADGLDVVADRSHALTQLCAPEPDAGALIRLLREQAPGECDEETLYRCTGGAVVSCAERAVVGRCIRGCFAEGASIGGEGPVPREAAFAILCSR
jgi:hypothetical protein